MRFTEALIVREATKHVLNSATGRSTLCGTVPQRVSVIHQVESSNRSFRSKLDGRQAIDLAVQIDLRWKEQLRVYSCIWWMQTFHWCYCCCCCWNNVINICEQITSPPNTVTLSVIQPEQWVRYTDKPRLSWAARPATCHWKPAKTSACSELTARTLPKRRAVSLLFFL